MVKEIRVTPQEQAVPGSQSSRHGTGAFPLHTDTVFWPDPVRYVILRGSGDTRRPTMVLSFAELFEQCEPAVRALARDLLDRLDWSEYWCFAPSIVRRKVAL